MKKSLVPYAWLSFTSVPYIKYCVSLGMSKTRRRGGGEGGGMSNLFADLKTPRDGRMYD